MLTINLLGNPQILVDSQPVIINRRKNRALLYYLAASKAPLTRNHLINFFWPDHERIMAQQLLRNAIHSLRQDLGQVSLVAGNHTIGLVPTAEVDIRVFEEGLTQLDPDLNLLNSTLKLYRGE